MKFIYWAIFAVSTVIAASIHVYLIVGQPCSRYCHQATPIWSSVLSNQNLDLIVMYALGYDKLSKTLGTWDTSKLTYHNIIREKLCNES